MLALLNRPKRSRKTFFRTRLSVGAQGTLKEGAAYYLRKVLTLVRVSRCTPKVSMYLATRERSGLSLVLEGLPLDVSAGVSREDSYLAWGYYY